VHEGFVKDHLQNNRNIFTYHWLNVTVLTVTIRLVYLTPVKSMHICSDERLSEVLVNNGVNRGLQFMEKRYILTLSSSTSSFLPFLLLRCLCVSFCPVSGSTTHGRLSLRLKHQNSQFSETATATWTHFYDR